MDKGKSNRYNKPEKLIPRFISDSLGKLPPQALDMEESVLAALILEKQAILEVADFLRADHFYSDVHKEIYSAVMDLFKNSDPIDMRSVVEQLRRLGKIEVVGGSVKIVEISTAASSAANIQHHARILVEYALKRDLIVIASGIHQDAYEDTTDVFELLGKIDDQLKEIADGTLRQKDEKPIKEHATQSVLNLQQRMQGKASGVPSGFEPLDRITHGFQNSDLIIIAARPGMGKTALVAQLCDNIASQGIPVGMFSLEMSAIQVSDRAIIARSEIHPDKIRMGSVSAFELERFTNFAGEIARLPWYIDDAAMLNIIDIRVGCRRMVIKHGVKVIIIDYLQLINGMVKSNTNNRDQEIGVITRTLKGIAKELNIPIIAISSLSRAVETRGGDKRPQLSDLRESGNIESDADVVMFLYRPEYYRITVDEDGMPTQGLAEIIFAKHRNGSTGTVQLRFIGQFTKFATWDGEKQLNAWQKAEVVAKDHLGPNFVPLQEAKDRNRELHEKYKGKDPTGEAYRDEDQPPARKKDFDDDAPF